MDADVIVVGAGLAGLVATRELVGAGRRVLLVDQESTEHLGGQAWWSFGGLFLVDSPEQRRMRIHDSVELAWQDWQGSAGLDRVEEPSGEDVWAGRWARAYVEWAAGEKRAWLHELGVRFFPVVGWASVATAPRPATATPCRASTSPGAPGPGWSGPSSRPCARGSRTAWWGCGGGTG